MDLDVFRLANAKRTVGCLVLHRRIPPSIKVKNMVSTGQVQASATSLEGQNKDLWAITISLEALDHAVAPLFRHGTVQEQHLTAKRLLQVFAEEFSHLGKL